MGKEASKQASAPSKRKKTIKRDFIVALGAGFDFAVLLGKIVLGTRMTVRTKNET